MKYYLFLFFLITSQNIFSQNAKLTNSDKSISKIEESIYDGNEIDKRPSFPNGFSDFYNYFGKNFNTYKTIDEVSGEIILTFVIEIDGSISNIVLLQDFDGLGKEAIRVMENCPNWIAAERKGKKVRARFRLPIKIP
jgi:protein TonB